MRQSTTELAEALWRAITYVSVAQLHLWDNVTGHRVLVRSDIKPAPSGHWGTVPGVAWILAHLALPEDSLPQVTPVIGPGHAGVAQLSLAWLTGDLERSCSRYTRTAEGLRSLARDFPDVDGLGAEVSPLLPGGAYQGGRLGGALGFACGLARGLGSADRVVVPIIGDGECETPATAAAWIAMTEQQGAVLPIVHVNGFRMGGRSVLGAMSDGDLVRYFASLGRRVAIADLDGDPATAHSRFRAQLGQGLQATAEGVPTTVVVRCSKGFTGPKRLRGAAFAGTSALHKTPLTEAARDEDEADILREWLASYRPRELFDLEGEPIDDLRAALSDVNLATWEAPRSATPMTRRPHRAEPSTFAEATASTLRRFAEQQELWVLSPDELASNRLAVLERESWVTELLAEEVLVDMLAGWTASGRCGLFVSYEAFATQAAASLIAHLKARRIAKAGRPSLNLLLTSYGWHNVYTHGDPSLATLLLATADPAVRVYMPADPVRTARVLDASLGSTDRCNAIVAGKHTRRTYSVATVDEELERGLAVWPDLTDESEPDLAVVCLGDVSSDVVRRAVPVLRSELGIRVRTVAVLDLTVLSTPERWPNGLTDGEFDDYFGTRSALLFVSLGHASAVWGLLAGRTRRPCQVIGWVEPPGPSSQEALAKQQRMTVRGVVEAASALIVGAAR